jgi:hypothetical protein
MKHTSNFSFDECRSYRFKPEALCRVDPNSVETPSYVSTSRGVHKAPFCFLHSTEPFRIERTVEQRWLTFCLLPATQNVSSHSLDWRVVQRSGTAAFWENVHCWWFELTGDGLRLGGLLDRAGCWAGKVVGQGRLLERAGCWTGQVVANVWRCAEMWVGNVGGDLNCFCNML